jgi:dipeptidyl aminopeptidase/acylaminoacyl peptidase
MKKLFFLTLMIGSTVFGQSQNTPLLDRDLFFGNPEIAGGQISPDGKYITFLKEYNGIMNIFIKGFDEPFDKARPVTESKRPLYGYFWTHDSKYILYVKDNDGDENMNVFAVNPSESTSGSAVPNSRNLTPMKNVSAQIFLVSKKNPDLMFVGLNDRDAAWHDLYQLSISTGKTKLLYKNTERITGFDFDWNEQMRAMSKTDEKGNTTLYKVGKKNKLTPIYSYNVQESAYIAGWTPDNKNCYFVSNKGDLDKSVLFMMNWETSELSQIESDPQNKVDFGSAIFDSESNKFVGTSYTVDKTTYYWRDEFYKDLYLFLEKQFEGREVFVQSTTKDKSKMLVATSGDRFAAELYLYDLATKKLTFQYTSRPALKAVEKYLAPMQPVSYKSSDGLEIPAYLTLPVGIDPTNLPVVMLIHGGPKGPRDTWGYDPEAQFLANRGYAVLQPNFRASGGYGKKFLNAGDGQWGLLMQDDITWGVKYLVDKGIADKSRVAIMGGSYGGYATLAGLAFTPELYACGVDIVGPSNIFTLLESVPAYWESGRAFLYGMVGDPNTEEGKKRIHDASPLFSADKIVKPLLIIQGANDPRVKQAEADQIVIALRDKGKQVQYLLAKDEGHGFAKPLNRKAMYAEVESFLASVLKGRAQTEMTQEISSTLSNLKVDVKTVVYKPKDKLNVSTLPTMQSSFQLGTTNYSLKLEVQGKTMEMEMIRTTEKVANGIQITDKTSGALASSDVGVFNANGQLIKRSMNQMGMEIPIEVSENSVTATVQGKEMKIAFEGAFLTDGPALDEIIGNWNLNEGFVVNLNMPDLSSGKAKLVSIAVTGSEKVNDKNCWIVELVNAENESDKTTFYINKGTHQAEKMVTVIPAYGNAVMTFLKK